MHLLLEFHKMSVDEAIENVLKFYTTKENKIDEQLCEIEELSLDKLIYILNDIYFVE